MGAVYKARQTHLDRIVALKILPPGLGSDPAFTDRFAREAQALARLNHPGIVTLYEFGQADGFYYFLMEYVDGVNLRRLLQAGRLAPREALAIVPQICDALQYAHDHGIVHRDIKPENILLDRQGRVKVADFGLAKLIGKEATVVPSHLTLTTASPDTEANRIVGTPQYMAPEQIQHPTDVDHRADIYSLGVVFYQMLTGELPGPRLEPPSHKVHIDVRLDEVVLRALEKEPCRRYQQASVLRTDVETIAVTGTSEPPDVRLATVPKETLGLSFNTLPELLPGERIVCFRKRLWAIFNKSWPLVYRLFFSLPPFWEAGMYVTDRRVLFLARLFGFWAQQFNIWFPGKAPDERRELLSEVATGKSRWCGTFLEIRSHDYRTRWWRSPELMLRLYLRDPETLQGRINAARAMPAELPPASPTSGANAATTNGTAKIRSPRWTLPFRWSARLLGTLWTVMYVTFVLAEGLPPIASQPGGVQGTFVGNFLMLAGFVSGWWRDGRAALLAAAGWTVIRVSEGNWNVTLFDVGLVVALLYAISWWGSQPRRTSTVVANAVVLAGFLLLGCLFSPTSVFVSGIVRDAKTGQPISDAGLALLPPAGDDHLPERPNTRTDEHGRFRLYIGWYSSRTKLAIAAPGYVTRTTALGPRPLGHRRLRRDFTLEAARNRLSRRRGRMARSKKTVTQSKQHAERKRGQSPFCAQHPAGRSGKRGLCPFPLRTLLECYSFCGTVRNEHFNAAWHAVGTCRSDDLECHQSGGGGERYRTRADRHVRFAHRRVRSLLDRRAPTQTQGNDEQCSTGQDRWGRRTFSPAR